MLLVSMVMMIKRDTNIAKMLIYIGKPLKASIIFRARRFIRYKRLGKAETSKSVEIDPVLKHVTIAHSYLNLRRL